MDYNKINSNRILRLMDQIENKTGQMFQDVYPELDSQVVKALDGEIKASYVINKLSQIVDELNGLE